MKEHLVQSHMGGYYISEGDEELIESFCETCGDRDIILTSWDNEEENARVYALASYFRYEGVQTEEQFLSRIKDYDGMCSTFEEKYAGLKDEIECDFDESMGIIRSLEEYKDIREDEFKYLMLIMRRNRRFQMKLLQQFKNTYVDSPQLMGEAAPQKMITYPKKNGNKTQK